MPRRSRISVSSRHCVSHTAMANMPTNRLTAGPIPQRSNAARITSLSPWPRKVAPMPASSRRNSRWLNTSPLKTMVYRPLADDIGWCPLGERSMIARRRKPKDTPASGLAQQPASSGPRCMSVAAITPAQWSNSLSPAPGLWNNPANPHIVRLARSALRGLEQASVHVRDLFRHGADRRPLSHTLLTGQTKLLGEIVVIHQVNARLGELLFPAWADQ